MINPSTYSIQTFSYKPKGTGLEARKEKFKKKVWIAIGKTFNEYSKKMCEDFISYWTEHNDNGKKMRFEKEKVFNVKRRLVTWKARSKDIVQPAAYKPPQTSQSDYVPPLDYEKAKERLQNEPKKTGYLSKLIQQQLNK